MTKNILIIIICAFHYNVQSQKLFKIDSIPDIFWNSLSINLYEQAQVNQYYEISYLWSLSVNNVLIDNLEENDSIVVVEAFGDFVNYKDSIIAHWTPKFPLNSKTIQQQAQQISKESEIEQLWFNVYAVGKFIVDTNSLKLDVLPSKFSIKMGRKNRISTISSSHRSVNYKYSISGRLKEIRFNHPDNPKSCPDAQGDEDCCCCCEGEPRKIVLQYKKGQLAYFTQYIYYAGDGQYYRYFLKYF